MIIDVRDNGGGWDESPADLFAHLAGQPFATYRKLSRTATDIPRNVECALDAKNFSDYVVAPADAASGMRRPGGLARLLDHYIGTHPMHGATWQPVEEPYTGRVWVLINEGSGSSGSEFPAYVKYYRRGVLVGRETVGGYAGCSGGTLPEIDLPNSGIRVRIPLVRYDFAFDLSPDEISGRVRPDVVVTPGREDVLSGSDVVLERTLQLVATAQARD